VELGVSRPTLYELMEKLGIQKIDREGKVEALPPSA
jgi:predicted DNA-binding transcriptional regulator AlpA